MRAYNKWGMGVFFACIVLFLTTAMAYADTCYDSGELVFRDYDPGYTGNVYVACGTTLQFKAPSTSGLHIKMQANSGIIVGECGDACDCDCLQPDSGTLLVQGSYSVPNKRVFFEPANGVSYWGGIILTENSDNNELKYAYIDDAGDSDWSGNATWDGTALFVGNDSNSEFNTLAIRYSVGDGLTCNDCTLTLSNGNIIYNDYDGVAVENDGDLTITGGVFEYNGYDGIRVSGESVLDVDWLGSLPLVSISGNGQYGLAVYDTGYPDEGYKTVTVKHAYIDYNDYTGVYVYEYGSFHMSYSTYVNSNDYGVIVKGRARLLASQWGSSYENHVNGNTIGGLVVTEGADVEATYTKFNNSSGFGMALQGGDTILTNCEVEGNDSVGIFMTDGTLDMSYSSVYDNCDDGFYYGGNTYYAGIFVTGAEGSDNYADHCEIYGNMHGTSGTYRKEFFNFALNGGSGLGDFYAQYTEWNTDNPEADAIFDYNDDSDFGDVDARNPQ